MPQLALQDITDACQRWTLWTHLGWNEVRLKYRRTALGPWWITLSMLIFVIALSVVYGKLFHQDMRTYLPFLFCGYLFWTFISQSLTDSPEIFFNSRMYIQQIKFPYFTYILKHMHRNIIMVGHNFAVYFLIMIYSHIVPGWNILLVIPGFILLSLNILWLSLILALLGSRFRDIPPIVTSLIQVVFFVSPITWMPKMLGADSILIRLNPVTYLLDVVRSPLLGHTPALSSWAINIGFIVVGFSLAFWIFARTRTRIPFWLV